MTDFGVTPIGFVRKGLQDILSEIEETNLQAFGAGIVQTPQSPTGQMNGLWADGVVEIYERAEGVYRSFDPDQAEGIRLDEIGRLRLLERVPGESDDSFARAITNAGAANVRDADFYRAVRNLNGVTWARIFTNDGDVQGSAIPAHSVAVAALGGEDDEIAFVARQFIVPGIISAGNTRVETDVDGFCRSIRIQRPTEVTVRLEVTVNKFNDRNGCPPPPNLSIATAIQSRLRGDTRPANGQSITLHLLRIALAQYPSVELLSARYAFGNDDLVSLPAAFTFDQIARVDTVTVVVANA